MLWGLERERERERERELEEVGVGIMKRFKGVFIDYMIKPSAVLKHVYHVCALLNWIMVIIQNIYELKIKKKKKRTRATPRPQLLITFLFT